MRTDALRLVLIAAAALLPLAGLPADKHWRGTSSALASAAANWVDKDGAAVENPPQDGESGNPGKIVWLPKPMAIIMR